MVEKILNNTSPYEKIRAPHEVSLHSSTLMKKKDSENTQKATKEAVTVFNEYLLLC